MKENGRDGIMVELEKLLLDTGAIDENFEVIDWPLYWDILLTLFGDDMVRRMYDDGSM